MCHIVLSEKPNSSAAYQFLTNCHAAKKQYKEAAQGVAKYWELLGDSKRAAHFKTGDFKYGMRKSIEDMIETTTFEFRSPIMMAWHYANLEDKDNTFKYLDFMINKRLPHISMVSQPYFDFLRDDPRYLELYEKAGFKDYDEYKLKQGVNLK